MQRRFRVRMVAVVAATVAAVATGCSGPAADRPTPVVAADAADVWFMQHLVPHLRQTVSVVVLLRGLPEVRLLARKLQAEDRRQLRQLTAWRDAWSGAQGRPEPA